MKVSVLGCFVFILGLLADGKKPICKETWQTTLVGQ